MLVQSLGHMGLIGLLLILAILENNGREISDGEQKNESKAGKNIQSGSNITAHLCKDT